jgi:hypothetical protein
MKHLQSEVNHLDLHNKLSGMKSNNKKAMKESKGRRVVSKEGIEYTIVDDMPSSMNDPFVKKKVAMTEKLIRKAGLPNFPPFED